MRARMRALSKQDLPYVEWAAARQVALDERIRARMLAQKNLCDKYGFKPGRRRGLIAKAVRTFYRKWSTLDV